MRLAQFDERPFLLLNTARYFVIERPELQLAFDGDIRIAQRRLTRLEESTSMLQRPILLRAWIFRWERKWPKIFDIRRFSQAASDRSKAATVPMCRHLQRQPVVARRAERCLRARNPQRCILTG
jgi:hypothetical protein